jgi:hypothetical protein
VNLPIAKILACVRTDQPPAAALDKLIAIGKRAKKSKLWDQLPKIDVDETSAWLAAQLEDKSITGVYLGLDTLNEDRGSNLELGTTKKCDPSANEIDWVYELGKTRKHHLIRGLAELRRAWLDEEDEELRMLFDYTLSFGYSGVVLASALSRKRLQKHALYVWGFHDGDMCPLARWSPEGFERLATPSEEE